MSSWDSQVATPPLILEATTLHDGDQDQEEVEAEVEGTQEDISLPQRITRSKFKELGSSGRMFSLFVVSFV